MALLLTYHRVATTEVDPWGLCVAPPRFAEQLDVLRKYYKPLPLQQLTEDLRTHGDVTNGVVVTFDDGYADVLREAVPLLDRHEIPATVFIVTGQLGAESEFWWDELERLLLRPGTLPARLQLRLATTHHGWDLRDDAVYDVAAFNRHRAWRPWTQGNPTARQAVFLSVWELMQRLTHEDRNDLLVQLRDWAGGGLPDRVPAPALDARRQAMSQRELATMGECRLVEIGAHTVTHPALSALDRERQRQEIRQCKTDLEALIGRSVTSFAYPYGRARDYTSETVELVRESGFSRACSTSAGLAGCDSDPLQLPRMNVGDWDGEEFAQRLTVAFAAPRPVSPRPTV